MDERDLTKMVAEHAAGCDECRETPLRIEPVAALLAAVTTDADIGGMSQRVLARLQPELTRQALAAAWRRALLGLALALLPLPAVLAYDAYWLRVVYDFVSTLLPTTVAAFLVLSYAALLVLLFALTYAAIPILVVREGPERVPALG